MGRRLYKTVGITEEMLAEASELTAMYQTFKILINRKEGVVGSMLAMPECYLLPEGEL